MKGNATGPAGSTVRGMTRDPEPPPARRFTMKEKLLGWGDDFWIEDERGKGAYKVDGKAGRMRDTWVLEDVDGHEVATIREKRLSVRDAVKIELASGPEAVVRKAVIGDRFVVDVDGGEDLEVKGDIVGHEYEVERDGDRVAEISKKWFGRGDAYGVEVEAGVDPALILAITVAVDSMSEE